MNLNIYPPGSRIDGRYEVASRPLMGGMGIVYLCYDHTDNRPVALKTFRPEYLPDRAARDRFLREGDTWIKLGKHPHIVHAYGVAYVGDGTEVYLVLELIAKAQGRQDASLRSWLTPGQPLPPAQAMLFALQIIRGMQHATETIPGFVHRDLKPENLLVGSDKLTNADIHRLRVTDLGLASVLGELHGVGKVDANDTSAFGRTQLTHGIVGTPLYMAPEQWRGEAVSVSTDIYALGCIVFEMLTGAQLVTGGSLSALEAAHTSGKHRTLSANLPVALRQWVERCLVVSPKERYASWADAEAGLKEVYTTVTRQSLPEPEAVQQLGRAERVAAGWAQSEIGNSYLDIGKAAVAKEYFERAAEVGRREGEKGLEGAALGDLGIAYKNLGDARRASGYYEQCLVIHREMGDRHGEGKTLGNLGNAYANLGDVRRASGYFEQRLAIAREMGDRQGEGTTLVNLGNVYANLGDARRAIGCYEQALVIHRAMGDRRGEGAALGNLGVAYKNLGNPRHAISYYEQHLTITREMGDRQGEGAALGNLGLAYATLGDARRAISYYEQQLTITREIGDLQGEAIASLNTANLYWEQGNTTQALPLAQHGLALFRQMGHPGAQNAERLIAVLGGRAPVGGGGSNEARIRQQFGQLIEAVVMGARENKQARAAVEQVFPELTQGGFQIVEPIQQIWKGERNASKLIQGLDETDSFIVREILSQLK